MQILTLTLDTRDNGPLLDGRWLLETIGINSPEQSFAQVHVIKTVHDLVPVTLQTDRFQVGALYLMRTLSCLQGVTSEHCMLCKLAERLGNAAPYLLKTGLHHRGSGSSQVLSEPPLGLLGSLKLHPPR